MKGGAYALFLGRLQAKSNDMITLEHRHDSKNESNLEKVKLFLINVFTSYGE